MDKAKKTLAGRRTLKKSHAEDAHEELKRLTVMLEEDQIEGLKALAVEYREKLGQRWTTSAMVRVAVGDFLTRMGKIS